MEIINDNTDNNADDEGVNDLLISIATNDVGREVVGVDVGGLDLVKDEGPAPKPRHHTPVHQALAVRQPLSKTNKAGRYSETCE
jgi:hypothetical protein